VRAAGVSALDFRFGDLLGSGKIHQISPAATRPRDALAARPRGPLAVGVRSSPHSGGNVGVTDQKKVHHWDGVGRCERKILQKNAGAGANKKCYRQNTPQEIKHEDILGHRL